MIKRSENFKLIDDAVKNVFANNKQEIVNLVKKINDLSEAKCEQKGKNIDNKSECNTKNTAKKEIKLDIEGTLKFIDKVLDNTIKNPNGFVLSYISRRYQAIKLESFEEFVKDIVVSETKKTFTNIQYYDTITVFKNISIGLDNPIYFYNYNGDICTLDDISGISNILRLDSDYQPVFYIYILIKNGENIVRDKREVLLSDIGNSIGNKLKDKIINELNVQIEQMEE